jgi:hypothetical protein
MAAARKVTPTIPRSPPAWRTEMDALRPHAPGQDWLAILARPTLAEFARAFSEAPVLEASVLAEPIRGAAGLRAYFEATRAMFEQMRSPPSIARGRRPGSSGKANIADCRSPASRS